MIIIKIKENSLTKMFSVLFLNVFINNITRGVDISVEINTTPKVWYGFIDNIEALRIPKVNIKKLKIR